MRSSGLGIVGVSARLELARSVQPYIHRSVVGSWAAGRLHRRPSAHDDGGPELADHHDDRLASDHAVTTTDGDRAVGYALEFRHSGWPTWASSSDACPQRLFTAVLVTPPYALTPGSGPGPLPVVVGAGQRAARLPPELGPQGATAQVPHWVSLDPDKVGLPPPSSSRSSPARWPSTHHRDGFGLDTDRKRAVRLLAHPLLVAWLWSATRTAGPR